MTKRLGEPTGTMSLVLTLKQIEHIKTQAVETGRSQADIGREIVERGIAAARTENSSTAEFSGTAPVPSQP